MKHRGKEEILRAHLAAVRCPLARLVIAGVMTWCGLAVGWPADVVRYTGFASTASDALTSVGPSLPKPLRVHLSIVGADPEMQTLIEQTVRGSGHARIIRDGHAEYSLQIHFLVHLDMNGREQACSWGFAAVRLAGADRLAFHEVYVGKRTDVRAKCRLGIAACARAMRGR